MPRVFISYNRADSDFANSLYARLTTDGVECFIDTKSIPWTANYVSALEAAIDEAEFFVVLLSPAYVEHDWPSLERTSVIAGDPMGRTHKIGALMVQSVPEAQMPRFTRPFVYLDVTTPSKFEAEYPRILEALRGVAGRPSHSDSVKAKFGLASVVVCPSRPGRGLYDVLGQAAANYLVENAGPNARVSLASANSIYAMASALPAFDTRISLFPLSSNLDPDMHGLMSSSATLLEVLKKNPRARAFAIPLPPFFTSDAEREALESRHDIRDLLEQAYDPNLAFYSVGHFGPSSSYSTVASFVQKYISPDFTPRTLADLGAVGEINWQPFAADGSSIPHAVPAKFSVLGLDRLRVLATDPNRRMVLVGGGPDKHQAILGALRGGLCNVLVTDSETIEFVFAA